MQIYWETKDLASDFELINEGTQNVTIKITSLSAKDNGYITCIGRNSVLRKSAKIEVQIDSKLTVGSLLFEGV